MRLEIDDRAIRPLVLYQRSARKHHALLWLCLFDFAEKQIAELHYIGGFESMQTRVKPENVSISACSDWTRNSDVDTAIEMSDYWRRAGFSVKTTTQAGVKVTRPDFFVVRLRGWCRRGWSRALFA